MKVVYKNEDNTVWPKIELCTAHNNEGEGCYSVLLIEKDDLYHTYCTTSGYLLGIVKNGSEPIVTDAFNTFKCPVCGAETDIGIFSRKLRWFDGRVEEEFFE